MPQLQKYLKAEIELRAWSMDEFARRAQLSLSNAYLIVRDGKDNVRQTTFDSIASALSVTPAELAVAIGKGALGEDPQRTTIQAALREVPEEDLGTVERIVRSFMRAKTRSALSAKARRGPISTASMRGDNGEDTVLRDGLHHSRRALAGAAA